MTPKFPAQGRRSAARRLAKRLAQLLSHPLLAAPLFSALLFGALVACSAAGVREDQVRDAPPEQLPALAATLEQRVAVAPQDAEAQRLLALAELRQGQLAAAARRALEAVHLAPFSGRHYAVLGEAYEAEGRLARALESYAHALALDPAQLPVYVRYARLQATLKEPQTALNTLAEALRREPRHFASRLLQARLLSETGQHAKAREAVEQARALRPNDREALRLHVQILQAGGRLAAALRVADEALAAQPDDAALLATLARLHRQRADWNAAQAALERLERVPGRGPLEPAERLLRVDVLDGLGRVAEARAALEALLRERSGYAPAHARLAEWLIRAAQPRQALAEAQQATALAPHLAGGHYWAAVAHYQLEDPSLGDAALAVAQQLAPQSRAARLLRAQRLLVAFRLDAAAPLLDALAREEPSAPALLLQSEQAALEGALARAADLLERVPPNFAPDAVHFARLRVAYLRGQWTEAAALAEPLLVHPLLGWRAAYLRGAALLRQGRVADALAVVTPLLQGRQRRVELYHLAGYLHLLGGDPASAQRVFQAGMAVAPGHPLMLDGLSRLAMDAEDWPRAQELLQQALQAPDGHRRLFLERLILVGQRRKDAQLTRSALERSLQAADPAREGAPPQPASVVLYGAFFPDFDLPDAL